MIETDTPEDIQTLNQRLSDLYGTDFLNKANFRIVWGPSQIETRVGTWHEFYMQTIFLRSWYGPKQVKKYPEAAWGECFILERIFSSLNFANKFGVFAKPPSDVVDWNGYEPLWSFKIPLPNGKFEAVRPNWKAVNLIVQNTLHGVRQTLEQMKTEEEDYWKKETEEVRMMLDDDLPWKIMQMKHGEGIVVPNNYGDSTVKET